MFILKGLNSLLIRRSVQSIAQRITAMALKPAKLDLQQLPVLEPDSPQAHSW
jgi:hypothetical protein